MGVEVVSPTINLTPDAEIALKNGTAVKISGDTGSVEHIDPDGYPVFVDKMHHMSCDGHVFGASYSEVINIGIKRFLVKIPADTLNHSIVFFSASGAASFRIKSDAIIITDGTQLTIKNVNDFSTRLSATNIYKDTMVSNAGVLVWNAIVGAAGGPTKVGGQAQSDDKHIWGCTSSIAQYKYYIIEIESKVDANEVGFNILFCEMDVR